MSLFVSCFTVGIGTLEKGEYVGMNVVENKEDTYNNNNNSTRLTFHRFLESFPMKMSRKLDS